MRRFATTIGMVTASIVMSLCSVSTRADAGSATTRPALPTPKAPYVVRPMAEPFSLFDARLLDGPFKESQDAHARYMLGLDPDRLAARFRVEAGLPAKAECYPGWENIELPGVGAGFYLSGCSRLYAATGDARFLERVNHLLDELEECQKANGNGFLLATKDGKRIFAEIERGDIRFAGGWMLNGQPEPYYAMEKLFAGLRDAWRVAGASKGLSIAVNLANYLEGQMSHLNDEQMQRIMSCEFGGMNWLLADLYADTGDPRYLALSRRWDHKAILDPLSRGEDILPGKHANTQFPKISGLAARFSFTGSTADRVTPEFFWDRVANHHSYVTGDNSLSEHFGPPDKLDQRLAANTTETCNAWNMMRLTGLLFAIRPDTKYADFTERVLWNHILAAQHPGTGRVCYFIPLESGHAKPYESLYETFRCCTCSSFDSYARHGDSIYFHDANTLLVNLYIASEVHWRDKGVVVRQETRTPLDETVRFQLTCPAPVRFRLAMRCPHWASQGMSVAINGQAQPVTGLPGNYAVIDRQWQQGDKVELHIPLPLRIETMPDNPHRVAIFKGPILLAGDLGPAEDAAEGDTSDSETDDASVLVTGDRPLTEWVKPSGDGSGFECQLTGVGLAKDVTLRPFFSLHDRRYAVYWDCISQSEGVARQARRKAEREREAALDARTIDRVKIGVAASEEAHQLKQSRSNTGQGAYGQFPKSRWRDAVEGWFSYRMKVPADQPTDLLCTFWGGEQGSRQFDILIDGTVIATESLGSSKPGEFYDKAYPIPADLTSGKKDIEVRFQAKPGNTAGGVFGVRMVNGKK